MRAYAYSAHAPTENADRVREQMSLAHRYQNDLIAAERARRAARTEIIDGDPVVATALRVAEAPAPERGDGDPVVDGLPNSDPARQRTRKDAWAAVSAARKLVSERHAEALEAIEERHGVWCRALRAACGVYWGTYLVVEDAVQRARRSGEEPKFQRWDGSGVVAAQLIGGMAVADLLGGEDTRVRLVGDRKWRELHLRVGSDEKRGPVWAVFPVSFHRDLPPKAIVKWVRVVRRRIGTSEKYSAQFVLDGEIPSLVPAPVRGAVAIDVGWRQVEGGLRVAAWVDSDDRAGTLIVPQALLARMQKVEDLRSIRDRLFNAALAELVAARKAGALPAWALAETEHAHSWQAPARLAAFVLRWRARWEEEHGRRLDAPRTTKEMPAPGLGGGDGSERPSAQNGDRATYRVTHGDPLLATLEGWRKQDKHLYQWEAHQRENVLRARREIYRLFARSMAQYRHVTVEKLDLRDFAEVPPATGGNEPREEPAIAAARGRRHFAALSELLGCLAGAVSDAGGQWTEAPPQHTTTTCWSCRHVEEFDHAAELVHVCSACGRSWDQDENAARNLLRAAREGALTEGRSRVKKPLPAGESEAGKRRAKGLAVRRMKGRSKSEENRPESRRDG